MKLFSLIEKEDLHRFDFIEKASKSLQT